jgi:hypothetical protein
VYGLPRSAVNSWERSHPSIEDRVINLNRRAAARRSRLILALAPVLALAGCQDPDIGTIRADRSAVEQLQSTNSDRPAPPSKTKTGRQQPDTNDLSPKHRGREIQP